MLTRVAKLLLGCPGEKRRWMLTDWFIGSSLIAIMMSVIKSTFIVTLTGSPFLSEFDGFVFKMKSSLMLCAQ